MNEEGTPAIQHITSQFNSWIKSKMQTVAAVLQRSLIVSLVVSSILWLSILIYISFLHIYLPDAVLTRPVHFQFRWVSEKDRLTIRIAYSYNHRQCIAEWCMYIIIRLAAWFILSISCRRGDCSVSRDKFCSFPTANVSLRDRPQVNSRLVKFDVQLLNSIVTGILK